MPDPNRPADPNGPVLTDPLPDSAPNPGPIPRHQRHIIDQVMPSNEVHVLGGPPGVGKTSFVYWMLDVIQSGGKFFGHQSNPTKCVFFSFDRSRDAHLRRLDSLGVPYDRFPFYSGIEKDYTLEQIVLGCTRHFPDHPLLFIDGFAAMIGGNTSNYTSMNAQLRQATRLCQENQRTILGTVHSAKLKEGEGYANPRDQLLGSTAWAGFSDMVISMQFQDPSNPQDSLRIINVCTRSGAGDFKVKLAKSPLDGTFTVWEDPIEQDLLSLMDYWLTKQDPTRLIPTRELLQTGMNEGSIPERTVYRWISESVETGKLLKIGKGKYQKSVPQ